MLEEKENNKKRKKKRRKEKGAEKKQIREETTIRKRGVQKVQERLQRQQGKAYAVSQRVPRNIRNSNATTVL